MAHDVRSPQRVRALTNKKVEFEEGSMKLQFKASPKVVKGTTPKNPPLKADNVKASSLKSLGIRLDNHNETFLVA